MRLPALLKTTALITGVLVAGEALLLLVGLRLPAEAALPWITPMNDTLLALDLVTGIGLVALALWVKEGRGEALLIGLAAVAVLTHGYRVWEVAAACANPFCANPVLAIMNVVKLAGALGVVVIGLVG